MRFESCEISHSVAPKSYLAGVNFDKPTAATLQSQHPANTPIARPTTNLTENASYIPPQTPPPLPLPKIIPRGSPPSPTPTPSTTPPPCLLHDDNTALRIQQTPHPLKTRQIPAALAPGAHPEAEPARVWKGSDGRGEGGAGEQAVS